MSSGNLGFDATQHEPSAPLEAVPDGYYNCRLGGTEIKETKNGNGKYLMLTLDIADGQYKGRKLFDRLNLWNSNGQAVEIANKTLSSLCHAVGLMQVRNHEDLRGKQVAVKVVKTNDPKYGEGNEVKGYKAAENSAQSYAQPAASAPAVAGAKPW